MSSESRRRGSLFVIAAPSGAGKTSLVKEVLKRDPALKVSISHTTRKPRPHEVDGQHYHFIQVDEFRRLRDAGEFLENAQVFDNFYGTGRRQVDALRDAGHNVILEIDWQGAQQVRKAAPDCISVFILPPSRRELEARLRNRKDRQRGSDRAAAQGFHCRHVALRGIRPGHRQRRLGKPPSGSCWKSSRDAPDTRPIGRDSRHCLPSAGSENSAEAAARLEGPKTGCWLPANPGAKPSVFPVDFFIPASWLSERFMARITVRRLPCPNVENIFQLVLLAARRRASLSQWRRAHRARGRERQAHRRGLALRLPRATSRRDAA
jgi:guanylate kinase